MTSLPATMAWDNGRQLQSFTKDNVTTTYKYNSDGMRTYKNSSDGSTQYYYDSNNNLIALCYTPTAGTKKVLNFFYDSEGSPVSFQVNSLEKYFYVKNLQGDIEKIINAYGEVLVTYTYDAWGNILSVTDNSTNNLSNLNPLRYRGYAYDNESGFYYLQSRYYDPQTGRFLNADVYFDTETGTSLSTNMFSYCENDPVNYVDNDGCIKTSIKQKKNNKLIFTIKFSDKDVRNIKSGIGWTETIAVITTAVLGYKEIISTFAALIIDAIVVGVGYAINDYIDRNNYGKGVKIKIFIKYGYVSYKEYSIRKNKKGYFYLKSKKKKIPYAYLYKFPKIIWIK